MNIKLLKLGLIITNLVNPAKAFLSPVIPPSSPTHFRKTDHESFPLSVVNSRELRSQDPR